MGEIIREGGDKGTLRKDKDSDNNESEDSIEMSKEAGKIDSGSGRGNNSW